VAEVWFVDLDAFGAFGAFGAGPGPAGLLDGQETARLRRIGEPVAARRFTAAHAALRLITAAYCEVAAERVGWARTEHGKPLLDLAGPPGPSDPPGRGAQVSLSHSGGWAAVALAPGPRPVGVDLELVRAEPPRLPSRVPGRVRDWVVPGRPEHFYRAWTRMEACVKAVGARLTDGLDLPVDRVGPAGPVRAGQGALAGNRWYVRDLAGPPGCAAAVALAGREPFAVRARHWAGPPDPGRPD
jgi:4'-phosphopantetheinyl transferase